MAYSIHKSDGTLVTVADNTKDTRYYSGSIPPGVGKGIIFIGRNEVDYGASIAQNILQVTENFANVTGGQPIGSAVLQGQLWYDKTLSTLFVRTTPGVGGADDMSNWSKVVTVNGSQTGTIPVVNPTPGTEKNGDTKITGTGLGTVIEIYAGGGWRKVFPAVYS